MRFCDLAVTVRSKFLQHMTTADTTTVTTTTVLLLILILLLLLLLIIIMMLLAGRLVLSFVTESRLILDKSIVVDIGDNDLMLV